MTNPKHTDTSRSGDLVERLRLKSHDTRETSPATCDDAANLIETQAREIERLRKALEQHGGRYWEARYRDEAAENERLREALVDLVEAVQRRTADLGGYDGRFGLNKTIVKARAALAGDSHDQ